MRKLTGALVLMTEPNSGRVGWLH